MPVERLAPTREGLIEALELLPEFSAAIVMHLMIDTPEDDGWALEHLGELDDAVDSWIEVLLELMKKRRAEQGGRN